MKSVAFPIRLFFFVLALALFALAGLGVPEYPRFRYIGWGLFFWAISLYDFGA